MTRNSFGRWFDFSRPALPLLGLAALVLTPHAAGAQSITISTLNSTNGYAPFGGLTEVNGTLYGTTARGGAGGDNGTVFSVNATSPTVNPVDVANFTDSAPDDGKKPYAGLTYDPDNNTLYGTTEFGGDGSGSVFSVALPATPGGASSAVNVVNTDTPPSDGFYPESDLTYSSGTLYGTATGSSGGYGELFSVSTTTGAITDLGDFDGANGAAPAGGVLDIGGTLYGTTSSYGANGVGDIYSYTAANGITDLANFGVVSGASNNGGSPSGDLIDVNGTLYGTATYGGAYGDGDLFSYTLADPSAGITDLADFGVPRGLGTVFGAYPYNAGLVYDPATGDLYGDAGYGGAYGDGIVFSFDPKNPSAGITDIHDFGRDTTVDGYAADGANPIGALTLGPNGVLYGNTQEGGAYNDGTVFALNPDGSPVPTAPATPEPSQMALFALVGIGLGALTLRARRKLAAQA